MKELRFCAKLLYYIITIGKQVKQRDSFAGMEAVFWGKFTEVLVGRADHCDDFYQHNHLSELKVFADDRHCFLGRNVTKGR